MFARSKDVPATPPVIGEDLLARRVDFEDLGPCRDEGIAIAQSLAGDRLLHLLLPEDLALAVALGDAGAVHLRNQKAFVADTLHVDRIGQVAALPARLAVAAQFHQLPAALEVLEGDQRQAKKWWLLFQFRQVDFCPVLLPPALPGVAGLFAVVAIRAQRYLRRLLPRQVDQDALG